jgi:hypothetical protein
LYPCDATEHRYVGPQNTIYPAIVDGTFSQRRKLRLCSSHFESYVEQLEKHAFDAFGDQERPPSRQCVLCSKPVEDAPVGFYATVYGHRQERRDFYGSVHDDCAPALAEDWHLPPQ